MYKNEIAFDNHENAMVVASMLLNEHYVVMLSKEENLTILNFEYSHNSDRNDVVFQNKEEYEEDWDKFREQYRESVLDELAWDITHGQTIEDILGIEL